MVGEEGVSINEVQIALVGMWHSLTQALHFLCRIKTEQIVQPVLNRIVVSISDWLVELNFL